jgi:hypothetical protein
MNHIKFLATVVLLVVSVLAKGQSLKFPPRDESNRDPELSKFVSTLKEIIQQKHHRRLIDAIHPQIKFDFDEGIGIERFNNKWHPEKTDSELWTILDKIVNLGGVFASDKPDDFFRFVFPYVNQVELGDDDDYFRTMVVTAENVKLRDRPTVSGKIVGHLSYDVVTFDYEKSKDTKWYYIVTKDKKLAGYVNEQFVYCPVDYRMFLTKEKGKWMISCLVAGD